jgi:hypothetical protein
VESYEIGIQNGAHQTIADADYTGKADALKTDGKRSSATQQKWLPGF